MSESVPGHPSRMHPIRGATEMAGRWHFLRCCQRMEMRYPGRMGSAQLNLWGDRTGHGESYGTPGHESPLGSHYCQPHFGTFLWSCMSLVQTGISLPAVLFVCFLTALFEVLFNTSCITFITQINFGAFDWKRSHSSSSTPKWQIMPTHYQYSKEQDISLVTMHS